MQAVRFHEYGGPEVLRLEEVPTPADLPPDGVLVRVRAAAVNPVDWKIRAGNMRAVRPYTLPLILGWDLAGEVVAAGPLARFAPGDRVFGYIRGNRQGAYAQYAMARSDELAATPPRLSDIQAAAVPLAALTAWMALFDGLDLRAGQSVLIHAAAGGVGGFAVQLAKLAGAKVVATCSAANADYVRALGAAQVIDYSSGDFAAGLGDLDAVMDTVGGEVTGRSLGVLRRGGALVSIAGPVDEAAAASRDIRVQRMALSANGSRVADLAQLIEAGKIQVCVAGTYPLAEAQAAHVASATGHIRGKLVLVVD